MARTALHNNLQHMLGLQSPAVPPPVTPAPVIVNPPPVNVTAPVTVNTIPIQDIEQRIALEIIDLEHSLGKLGPKALRPLIRLNITSRAALTEAVQLHAAQLEQDLRHAGFDDADDLIKHWQRQLP